MAFLLIVKTHQPRMDKVYSTSKDSTGNALLAVPKKGRLYDCCIKLLNGAGLDHVRPNRLDVAHCFSLPVTIVFLPAADIATYVAEGDVDAGITGLDVVRESEADVLEVLVRAIYNFDQITKPFKSYTIMHIIWILHEN